MPNRDGRGPDGEGKPGRGFGPCSKDRGTTPGSNRGGFNKKNRGRGKQR